jgi:hypothetical protein
MVWDKLKKNITGNLKAYKQYADAKVQSAKTKQKIKDVQALHRQKRGKQPKNWSGTLRANRAASRLGVNPNKQYPIR